ncbi:uncharacterized protein PAC_01209 [Phialocephala subalpina]|uniref:PNPLA domain-containing protein n=1 Tax=Phialocephala subalpina TaxID=576137 RepID=A0A1L7WEX6_9HELO|nr:uncharacterized protein PAC_01209 [Phialocephala subalpina]
MPSSEDDDHESGGEDVDRCDIYSCGTSSEELFFCPGCELTLCSRCWKAQGAHNPKRKNTRRSGPISPVEETKPTLHEKTRLETVRLVQPAFSNAADEETLELRLAEDADAAWFGVSRDRSDDGPLFLHDHGRYGELMAAASNSLPSRVHTQRDSQASTSSSNLPPRRTPSLVSFVGQSGAGKSTLIKLLILLEAPPGTAIPQCPIVGSSGSDVPTSEDVHLYLDPPTFHSDAPILYADCEGLDGGEREPMTTAYRSKRKPRDAPEAEESSDDETSSFQAGCSSKRELRWAKSRTERTRSFAVSRFYPRLLFTFSDMVIFVHRNPKVIESVFEQLIKWAAAALETANNQPILPYAIIVLNACPHDIDAKLWDIDFATKSLLESLSETVNKNDTFAQYAKFWRERGREVKNIEELMMCYYSSVRVIRLPTDMQPNLVFGQVQKLHAEIERGCKSARERKVDLRMLLDADEFQSYLGDAFDHYSRSLGVPFDFVQASFLHNPIPFNFGGNILKLAISMARDEKPAMDAPTIFTKLRNLVASCIMLDAVRHNILGTANHIFPQYLDHLDGALSDFCDRYWPCEYIERGITPAALQYDFDHSQHWSVMASHTLTYRCVNVRVGHDSKGHQNSHGRIFARGTYYSRFSFENSRDSFCTGAYFGLERLLNQLANFTKRGEEQVVVAGNMHRKSLQEFFNKPSKVASIILRNHSVCWCCLFEAPEHALACGHVLCTPCLKAYGRPEGRNIVRIHECPFESCSSQPRSIYIKPETAGIRILLLDDGGVRSVIQLEILHLLEQELGGKLPIQLFFDMIVAKGSGSVVALGLLNTQWNLDDCIANFLRILKQSFSSQSRRKFSKLKNSTYKYHSKALEQSLREAFTENQALSGAGTDGRVGAVPKIAIPVTSATKDASAGIKIWEAARAAMAHTLLFKPFKRTYKATNQVYGSPEQDGNPLATALSEFKNIWGSSSSASLDTVVSLGTGLGIGTTAAHAGLDIRTNFWKTGRSIIRSSKPRAQARFDQQCERTWNDHVKSLSTSNGNHVRLNIDAIDLPAFDDIEKADSLRNMVRTQIKSKEIRRLACRLLAKLFYFEKTSEPEVSSNELFLRGDIFCRIPDGTPALAEVGNLFLNGRFHLSKLIVQEASGSPQPFDVSQQVIEDMIHDLQFRMPELKIRLSQQAAEVDITLLFANRKEYSISGFPRTLAGKGAQTRSNARNSVGSATGIRRRPQWSPPSPTSARNSSFDSGIQLSSRPASLSSTPIAPPPRSPRRLVQQPPQELPGSSPLTLQELPANDTRDPRSIAKAMKLELERYKIRKEKVAPLEERLRRLEANQDVLTSLLEGLQSPSSSGSGSVLNSRDFDDSPLIDFSRTNTVRKPGDSRGEYDGHQILIPNGSSSKADRVLGRNPNADGSGAGSFLDS